MPYDNKYLNATPYADGGKTPDLCRFVWTENLVFEAKTEKSKSCWMPQLTWASAMPVVPQGTDQESARFDISSGGDGIYQFNRRLCDWQGCEVHTTLTPGQLVTCTNGARWARGNLHIEGDGANNILLNVGGKGRHITRHAPLAESGLLRRLQCAGQHRGQRW